MALLTFDTTLSTNSLVVFNWASVPNSIASGGSGVSISNYQIQYLLAGVWTIVATVAGGITTVTSTGTVLNPGQTY